MDSFELPTDNYDLSQLRKPSQNTAETPPAADRHDTQPIKEQPKTNPTANEKAKKTAAAKPTKTESPTTNRDQVEYPSLKTFFTDGRLRIFLGILLILTAGYMLIVSISYLSSGQADQSIVQNRTVEQIAAEHSQVSNTGGWIGAFLSHLIMYKWLGLGAFIIIYYVGAVGITLVRLYKFKFWQLTFKSLVSAISVSVITGLLTYTTVSPTFWGGEHGYYINTILIDNASWWGAIGVSILLLSAVILIFLTPISNVCRSISRQWKRHRQRLAERHNAAIKAASEAERRAQQQRAAATSETAASEATGNRPTESATDTAPQSTPISDLADTPFVPSFYDRGKEYTASSDDTVPTELSPEATATSTAHHDVETETITPSDDLEEIPVVTVDDSDDESTAAKEETTDTVPTKATNDAPLIVDNKEIEKADEINIDAYDPTAELSRYRFPSIDLLKLRASSGPSIDEVEQEENKQRIIRTLNSYGIEIASIKATVGPTITLYEIVPAEGVRIAKIKRLGDDMTLSLSATGIRIIAPMPGKGTIGMEVPNSNPQIVDIRTILSSKAYQESKAELPMAMGTTISNEVYVTDLTKMPHLLVAGATGMGKSVGLNTIIASLLYKKHPAELKFVLVDPKMVEFSLYKCLERHYLAKLPEEDDAIITDSSKVVATLNSLCVEMDNRYTLLSKAGMRGIKEYNQKFISRRLNPEKGHRYLPYIVVIIDEFADLIMTAGKEVETPIARIAQKARAVGIHMILATQRPSVNVITGIIKANFPGRVAFRVTQGVDSKTILDRPGAEQLVGRGDMLFSRDGIIERVQCAFIDTDEVEAICQSISEQIGYPCAYELPDYIPPTDNAVGGARGNLTDRDPLFPDAGRAIIDSGVGSTSFLQRKYNIGYPRAGKIMDQLEMAGVVGPAQGGKPRTVLMDSLSFERLLEG